MDSLNLVDFFTTAAGSQLRRWEATEADALLAHEAGETALQLGVPYGQVLRSASHEIKIYGAHANEPCEAVKPSVKLSFDHLPFREASFDLVVCVHAHERVGEAFFKEVFRVLAPEGRLVVFGINPWGPWWLRKKEKLIDKEEYFSPLSVSRIKTLCSQYGVIDRGRFGLYSPSLNDNPCALARWGWCEKAGDRWWPALANAFMLSAVKHNVSPKAVGKIIDKESILSSWQRAPVASHMSGK